MREARQNFLVGLFMVVGLAVLGFLMVLFGEAPSWLGGSEWRLDIIVEEIAGLDEGTPVYMNGIKIGRVQSLEFRDPRLPEEGVKIVAMIKSGFQVPQGATAKCISPALGIGRGRVDIEAHGEGQPPVPKGQSITGTMKNPLEDVLPQSVLDTLETSAERIGNFAQELTPVAQDLHELLKVAPMAQVDDPQTAAQVSANLYTAVQRLDALIKHFNVVLGDPDTQTGLRESVANIRQMTVDGRETMAQLRQTSVKLHDDLDRLNTRVDGTIDNFNQRVDEVAAAAVPALEEFGRTGKNLNRITTDLAEGRGTIGRLLTDERFYEILVLATERLSDTLASLKRLAERFESTGRIGISYEGIPVDKKLPPK